MKNLFKYNLAALICGSTLLAGSVYASDVNFDAEMASIQDRVMLGEILPSEAEELIESLLTGGQAVAAEAPAPALADDDFYGGAAPVPVPAAVAAAEERDEFGFTPEQRRAAEAEARDAEDDYYQRLIAEAEANPESPERLAAAAREAQASLANNLAMEDARAAGLVYAHGGVVDADAINAAVMQRAIEESQAKVDALAAAVDDAVAEAGAQADPAVLAEIAQLRALVDAQNAELARLRAAPAGAGPAAPAVAAAPRGRIPPPPPMPVAKAPAVAPAPGRADLNAAIAGPRPALRPADERELAPAPAPGDRDAAMAAIRAGGVNLNPAANRELAPAPVVVKEGRAALFDQIAGDRPALRRAADRQLADRAPEPRGMGAAMDASPALERARYLAAQMAQRRIALDEDANAWSDSEE